MTRCSFSLVAFRTLSVASSILGVAASFVPRQETSTAAPPTGSPFPMSFSFTGNEDLLKPVTCQPQYVNWIYKGSWSRDDNIDLYVTNVGVSQETSVSSSIRELADLPLTNISVTLGTDIDPFRLPFYWLVNVPPGKYVFDASLPDMSIVHSVPFRVYAGNDTSCIPFSTPTPTPVAGATQTDSLIGVIVGGCFGLAIVVAALIGAYVWFKRRRDRKRHGKGEYPNATRHWKELGSADSQGALRGDQPRLYHHSSNNSVNQSAQSDDGADKSSIHSKLESTALSCEQEVALAGLPVLTHQSSRSRTFPIDRPQSSSSLTTSGPSASPTPERRLSVRDTTSNRRSLDLVAYPPITTPSEDSGQPPTQIPSTPLGDSRLSLQPGSPITVEATKQANRQSFGRKRKPVPVYDGEEPTSPSVPPPLPTSPVSPSSSPLETFLSASPASSSIGHYVTRKHSVQESGHPDQALKGNFGPGDRTMHYLIPDMPMSQQ